MAGQVAMASVDFPHGGPTVPSLIVKLFEIVPVLLTVTRREYEMALQPTPTELLTGEGSATFGSLGASLHSRKFPIPDGVKPDPVTDTDSPFVKPVVGVTDMVPVRLLAKAVLDNPHVATPTAISAATAHKCLRPAPLRLPRSSATATTPPAP